MTLHTYIACLKIQYNIAVNKSRDLTRTYEQRLQYIKDAIDTRRLLDEANPRRDA